MEIAIFVRPKGVTIGWLATKARKTVNRAVSDKLPYIHPRHYQNHYRRKNYVRSDDSLRRNFVSNDLRVLSQSSALTVVIKKSGEDDCGSTSEYLEQSI